MTHVGRPPVLFVRQLRALACGVLFFVALLPQSTPAATPSRRADFFIVEHVHALRIYDIYQQPVRTPAEAGILPFTPFRIVEWESVMGDGFTPCARTEFGGKVYILLRDTETRGLIGEGRLGYNRVLRNAEEVDDTVLVQSVRRLELRGPTGTNRLPLKAGERLVRFFRYDGRTYVSSELSKGMFGWVSFPATGAEGEWTVIHETGPAPTLSRINALPRIQARVEEANATLQRIYAFLNAETGSRRPAPRWDVVSVDSSYVCILHSSLPPESHAESSAQLAKRIESQLLGTGYRVEHRPGRIEVRP